MSDRDARMLVSIDLRHRSVSRADVEWPDPFVRKVLVWGGSPTR